MKRINQVLRTVNDNKSHSQNLKNTKNKENILKASQKKFRTVHIQTKDQCLQNFKRKLDIPPANIIPCKE